MPNPRRRAGRLKDEIRIETPSYTRNEFGDDIPSWSTFREVSADVQVLSSTEQEQNDAIVGQQQYRIDLRYIEDFAQVSNKEKRIVWTNNSDKVLDITGVDTSARFRGWMTLFARERDDQ